MTGRADDINIKSLLRAALSEEPEDDMPDRVLSRLAAVKTVVELGRLFTVAPVDTWREDSDQENDEENNDDD